MRAVIASVVVCFGSNVFFFGRSRLPLLTGAAFISISFLHFLCKQVLPDMSQKRARSVSATTRPKVPALAVALLETRT